MDLISPKKDILTEFMVATGCRISATIVDLITPNRDILTRFTAETGRRISVTIVDLISPKRDILTEFTTGMHIFCNHCASDISKQEYFNGVYIHD